ncbi:hypothetical protein HERIO_1705 [Hepatospora eriocheir]|uniref:Uncharacterized protein n=1 Tax=Hepatospora eriocheir TaxID=1081669 RepID=A0A1X0Q9K0_9MICR|nr:hypothetical protein HERIO_1705 [Hepatospora eriocheir]
MTVKKKRYIAFKYKFINDVVVICKERLKEKFGLLLMSKLDFINVVENYEENKICVIRCNLEIYKELKEVLNENYKVSDVSGILRKLKLRLINQIKLNKI